MGQRHAVPVYVSHEGNEMMTGEHMPPHPELRNGPCQTAICNVQTCLRLHNFDEQDCQDTISRYIDCAESHPEHYYVPTRSRAIVDVEEDAASSL